MLPSRNIDMGNLPPCNKCLVQHIRRSNYQIGIWKRSHFPEPDVPKASRDHGWDIKDGCVNPLWYEGDVLPRELADIAQVSPDQSDCDDDSDSDFDANQDVGIVSEESDSDC